MYFSPQQLLMTREFSPLQVFIFPRLKRYRRTRSISNTQHKQSREFFIVRTTDTFISSLYVKSHLDDDSCLPICKTIPAISNTPRQTHFVGNSIFPHFVMVMTVLWAELWSVVARCNLAGNVGILEQNYFDKLDTWVSRRVTF
jgi:hypothetical protein